MMKVSKSGVDPNTVISTCFNGLDEHRNPADVFNVWKRVIELQHKLGKASRLNLSSGSAQVSTRVRVSVTLLRCVVACAAKCFSKFQTGNVQSHATAKYH